MKISSTAPMALALGVVYGATGVACVAHGVPAWIAIAGFFVLLFAFIYWSRES